MASPAPQPRNLIAAFSISPPPPRAVASAAAASALLAQDEKLPQSCLKLLAYAGEVGDGLSSYAMLSLTSFF